MGIQDRDYYRDKNAVNINYNPKEFRGSSGSSVNKAPESKAKKRHFSGRRFWYWLLLIISAISAIAVERVLTFETIKTKFEIFLRKSEGSPIKAIENLINSKDIIPGITAAAQTNFRKTFKTIDIEFSIPNVNEALSRYSLHTDFYFEGPDGNGSIAFKILNFDAKKNVVDGKIDLYMWGAVSPIYGDDAKRELQHCPAHVKRALEVSDSRECAAKLSHNMSVLTRTAMGKPIKIRLVNKENDAIHGFYTNEFGKQMMIGGFNIAPGARIKNLVTHSIHYPGTISDCEEMKPVSFEIISVKNDGVVGSMFAHKLDDKYECKGRVIANAKNGKIILGMK